MTTGISLIRENTASMQPPRALWVSFPLGRPLGKPGDPAFQHRVISAALDLLNRNDGPVLEDYQEDAPQIEIEHAPACPVTFAKKTSDIEGWTEALRAEVEALKPWHDLGRRRKKGRTLVGLSSLSVMDNALKFADLLENNELPVTELKWFKAALEDTKVFYLEAITAQPGAYEHTYIEQIFWSETLMGKAMLALHEHFSDDDGLSAFTRIMAPRSAVSGAKKRT